MAQKDYGGKPAPTWKNEVGFDFVGYSKAILRATDNVTPNRKFDICFLTGPTDFSLSISNNIDVNKTNNKWTILNGPRVPGTLTMNGFLIDSKGCPERLYFIQRFMRVIEEPVTSAGEVDSKYNHSIIMEGITYNGVVQTFNYSKSGTNPFLYNAQIVFSFSDYVVDASVSVAASAKKITGPSFTKKTTLASFDKEVDYSKAMNIVDLTFAKNLSKTILDQTTGETISQQIRDSNFISRNFYEEQIAEQNKNYNQEVRYIMAE